MSGTRIGPILALAAALVCGGQAGADAALERLLAPPPQAGPVEVKAYFELNDVNEIDDSNETFEFSGILRLEWRDPRLAFDPAQAGVEEKLFQGAYQFNELAAGWYPQLVLVNESGLYQSSGVTLRVRPDGTSTLIQTLNAAAKVELDIRRFPFDRQRLEAAFVVLGAPSDEVRLSVDPEAHDALAETVRIPQWGITSATFETEERSLAGQTASALVLRVDVSRHSFYFNRLVILPLIVIVLLSFCVFWMERSSLGDRVGVSFIGVLTVVTYQLLINDSMPRISYVTSIHAFLSFSFLTMCATIVINLVVGWLDKQGKHERGDRLDRLCRWLFPLVYFGLILVIAVVAWLFF